MNGSKKKAVNSASISMMKASHVIMVVAAAWRR